MGTLGNARRERRKARQMDKIERRVNRKHLRLATDHYEDDIYPDLAQSAKPYQNYHNDWNYCGYKDRSRGFPDASKKITHQQLFYQDEKIYDDCEFYFMESS